MSSTTLHPLTIREFVHKFIEDENIFNFLPQFAFIRPLAAKWKSQNCACGLGPDIQRTISVFNEVVKDLDKDIVANVSAYFNITEVCFAIQTPQNHEIKCY